MKRLNKTAGGRQGLILYLAIAAAVRGEPEEVNLVIRHYSGYIAALATRTSYDAFGFPHSHADEELRRRLETKLMVAIWGFDLN